MARASEERGFRYQKRSVEDVRERANARGGGFDSIVKAKYKMFKVKDGKNLIRILPPTWEKARHYGYDLWVNYGIGVDNQSYLSLSKMKGEADPLAEARRAAEKDGDKDAVKALNPRQRILMWIIDRNNEDEGPLLWAAPISVDKALAGLSYDEDTKEFLSIDHPEEGNDVRFYKEGQGLKTDYPPEKMRILKTTPLHEDPAQIKDWLEFIQDNPLPDCCQFYDYDYIATMFDGTVRTEAPADEEAPATRKKAATNGEDDEPPPRRQRAAPVDDDDGRPPSRGRTRISDPDEDPAPEETVRPRRGRQAIEEDEPPFEDPKPRRRAAPVDDDDPPPRRGRAAPAEDPDDDPPPRGSIRDRIKPRGRIEADDD